MKEIVEMKIWPLFPTGSSGSNLVSSLLFLPIDIGHFNDNGTYTCAMNLNSDDSLILSSQPNSTNTGVTVQSKLLLFCTIIIALGALFYSACFFLLMGNCNFWCHCLHFENYHAIYA